MHANRLAAALAALLLCSAPAFAAPPDSPAPSGQADTDQSASLARKLSTPLSVTTHDTVTVEGKSISYEAVAGTLVIDGTGSKESTPEIAMGYFAYFKQGADPSKRPITFIYNGGPGSSTVWLHMGAWGPKRVVTRDDTHTPAAPYQLVNNDYSLLDASDLVFIDMPGTGFGRLLPQGKDDAARAQDHKRLAKQTWGVDGDAQAFSHFITQFLSKYNRWNSPKYLFGESYGTTRSAVLANVLQEQDNVDLNGVILLSQILNFGTSVDGAEADPGNDLPYMVGLPTYAATAWYHHKLPKYGAGQLGKLLNDAIAFAKGEYHDALYAGATLGPQQKREVAGKLHDFTGLPVAYLLQANLRVTGGMFAKELQTDSDTTTGRLDSRFSGPAMDPLGKEADYDPQSAAISSAYVSAFNNYVRNDLKFGEGMQYRPSAYGAEDFDWDFKHKAPGAGFAWPSVNVMGDLAAAMKYNPNLKVMMAGGLYDLATTFYAATYELEHLPIPASLQKNISYAFYPSGHMVYAHLPSLQKLHDDVARFIDSTHNQGK
ncbi:MAG: peptidase S10 [Xanthomonadales bacterium]|nr:peptidase S10 [Xanthomonadales bacterium]ODU92930.1 MAG: peptidase S10 [Rhodanobacter sp. SCN 66-43]OJY83720.1 MAG: peptidase S10 [Xanthomonadales bacterium 66-474]